MELVAYTAKRIITPFEAPQGVYKVGEPYQVDGVWYTPAEDPGYDKVGVASWYGEEFDGRPTANGGVYDMNALTGAHPTLPMPSMVRVTNLENGRSLVLTVNDRGPFVGGRIIDVSRRVAQLLGFYQQGTARVRVQAVGGEPAAPLIAERSPSPPLAKPSNAVTREPLPPVSVAAAATSAPARELPARYIQVGAFANADNARRLSSALAHFGPTEMMPAIVGGREVYRVRLGPLGSLHEANALLARVAAAGHRDARLVAE